jgi:hypothetical protein
VGDHWGPPNQSFRDALRFLNFGQYYYYKALAQIFLFKNFFALDFSERFRQFLIR